ncbi:hypothetical protein [Alienimonas californiensis]|uniref:Uncharacterized protein n=1 Tax=Alienimonas californiensis TaxID=2527989 RepID=A0A517P8F8_9PLAN|nr:hypothetical protein [Alienimonas californiensis]QDT15654.1 hypothetical protein CA12_17390 [Alienimonas californiensis]
MLTHCACPTCGAAVSTGTGRWTVCPHCREAFDAAIAAPAVVFEDVTPADSVVSLKAIAEPTDDPKPPTLREPQAPAAQRAAAAPSARSPGTSGAKPKPKAASRRSRPAPENASDAPPLRRPPRKTPVRKRRPAPSSDSWLTGEGLSDIAWEDETAPPPPPPPREPNPKKKPRRAKRRKRPASDRDPAADVGLAIMSLLTLFMVGPPLLTISNLIEAGRGPTLVEIVRWILTALLMIGLWSGSPFVRIVWCVLMWFVGLILVGVTLIALGGDDPRTPFLVVSTGIFLAAVFVLTLMVYNPWFNAFMERQRGER